MNERKEKKKSINTSFCVMSKKNTSTFIVFFCQSFVVVLNTILHMYTNNAAHIPSADLFSIPQNDIHQQIVIWTCFFFFSSDANLFLFKDQSSIALRELCDDNHTENPRTLQYVKADTNNILNARETNQQFVLNYSKHSSVLSMREIVLYFSDVLSLD